MRYEYAEAQPEFQVPDPSIQDRSDLAGDIPADFPEDMSGAVDVTADYPEIAEDVDSGRAELQEAPEIAEDVGPYRAEMPEVPEIAEDVPGAEYPEYPWMNDTVQDPGRKSPPCCFRMLRRSLRTPIRKPRMNCLHASTRTSRLRCMIPKEQKRPRNSRFRFRVRIPAGAVRIYRSIPWAAIRYPAMW